MRPAFVLSLLLLSSAAYGAPEKPLVPKEVTTEDKLFNQLKHAGSSEEAHGIEQKLMAMFRASGSPSVDLLITRVQTEAVTNIAPNYAEGWHMRAEMEQAADDETAALVSLQKVVLLNPRHFMALAELADRLEEYGDKAGALKLYRRALEVDPKLDVASRKVRELTQSVEGRDI
jgi:tetratricopeptide (TPR) repeat protein